MEAAPLAIGHKAASGAMLMVGARLLTRFVDLATMLIFTRLLHPADFGLVAIAASIVAILEAIFELPLNQALLRLPVVLRQHYDTAFTISLMRGLLLAAILIALAWPMASFYHEPRLALLICVLSISPVMRGLANPRMVEFQKNMSFWRDFAIEIGGKLAAFAVGATVAVMTRSYWAIAIGTALYPAVMTAQSYWFASYRPRLSLSEFRVFSSFAGWVTAAQVLSAMNWQFERLLLGKLKSLSMLGLFTTASDITNIPFVALFGPMSRPLLAAFTHMQDDPRRMAASYQKASVAMVAVGLPLLVGESLLADQTVRVVVGQSFKGAGPLVRWLALSMAPALFTLPTTSLLMALGRTNVMLKRNLVEVVVKIPMTLAGTMLYGFPGLIVARFTSEFAADMFSMIVLRKLIGLSLREQMMGWRRSIVATLVMAAIVEVLRRILPAGDDLGSAAITLLVAGPVGAMSYTAAMLLLWRRAGKPDGPEAMLVAMARRLILRLRLPERALR